MSTARARTRRADALPLPPAAAQRVRGVLASPGQALAPEPRAEMEARLGHDFARVRVHADGEAEASARALGARAWTLGRHLVFGARQPSPASGEGKRLLAHELAHVVQQRGAEPGPADTLRLGRPDDAREGEARRAAAAGTAHGGSLSAADAGVIQRQEEVCEMPPGVVYDEEAQECRLEDAGAEPATAPETDPVDGEFWTMPAGVRQPAEPLFDPESNAVVAFRYSSGGYYEVYDLEGNFVESGEPGLEAPLIDPIDILAGGITGLGRGLLRGMARGVGRGAGRGAAGAVGAAGLRLAASTLGKAALTAVRGVYRAIRFRGALNFTTTTAARMADPARRVPHHILKLAVRYGKRTPDPQGVAGAFMYRIPMFRNGREYTLEVLLREADQTVLHFLYK